MKFVKLNERYVNTEQIVCVTEENGFYNIRMANADFYLVRMDKEVKKIMAEILGDANIQLSSKRVTERTDRSLQRPAK